MIAYFIPGAASQPARDIPQAARLLDAGPWSATEFNHHEAGAGVLVTWKDQPLSTEEARKPANWRKCADGLWYCRGPVLPNQELLAKRSCPAGIDVMLASGIMLTVPLATAAPRAISFCDGTLGQPVTEFGRCADTVFDRMTNTKDATGKIKGLPLLDTGVLRLVTLAIMAAYRVTPELLDDLQWITSSDIDSILCAIMGTDPKALEPAGSSLPLPAGV